ncbi:UNVERIFIED_CONTAM: raffinose/stachyose/melibiose transport system substrate-binding protein [Brevibacillus sp. OAP136]
MKKASSGFLATVMALSLGLAACSGGGGEGTATTEPAKGDEAPESKEVNLTMTSWRVEDVEGYKKIIAAFEAQNPGIKISFKPQKATEYNTILNTALQSSSAADIIQLRPYATGIAIADGGYLEPLDGVKGLDAIPKEALDSARGKDGKVYGVPLSLNSTQIYYNKKIFADNGLSEPKSWDELIALAKTLKAKNIIPFAFGAKESWLLSLSHGVIAPGTYNGNAFVEKMLKGEASMTSPEYKASIQRMKDLTPYFPDHFVGLDLNDIRALFATEKAAMFINGSFELEVIQKMNPNLQIDFFPMPTDDGNAGDHDMGGWLFCGQCKIAAQGGSTQVHGIHGDPDIRRAVRQYVQADQRDSRREGRRSARQQDGAAVGYDFDPVCSPSPLQRRRSVDEKSDGKRSARHVFGQNDAGAGS